LHAIDDLIIVIYDADGEEWTDALRYKMNQQTSSPGGERSGLSSYQLIRNTQALPVEAQN
jgi:hypothetical protein